MKRCASLPVLLCSIAWSGSVMAHAVPERTVPVAGEILSQTPQTVTMFFDSELEPLFSKLVVKDAQGVQISVGSGEIAAGNPKALAARLTTAGKGAYRVYWNVVSRDGHRARGAYGFTVR